MTDLLTTLQQATEPSRELDARIHAWVKGWDLASMDSEPFLYLTDLPPYNERLQTPHYTSNLQDALELVPDEWIWRIWRASGSEYGAVVYQDSLDRSITLLYTSPALALANAAVEARMKLTDHPEE